MISFEDLILIFYIWVPNTTIKGTIKEVQFKQHFATTFKRLTKKIMIFVYHSIFPYTWPCVLPIVQCVEYYTQYFQLSIQDIIKTKHLAPALYVKK